MLHKVKWPRNCNTSILGVHIEHKGDIVNYVLYLMVILISFQQKLQNINEEDVLFLQT